MVTLSTVPSELKRGWFNAFLSRFRITLRKQTNTKAKSVEQRKAGIQQWHARLRRRIKRGTDVHPKWGRWLPESRFNVDQVPLTLADGSRQTYDEVGARRVWISGSKHGDDKREATLQLCVRLSNSAQQPKPTTIFRGKGLRLKKAEKGSWDSRVHVLFQPKAWADNICLHWAESIFPASVTEGAASVLFCDNLVHQTTDEFWSTLRKANTKLHLLKSDCTDEIQVIDAGIGKKTKNLIGQQCEEWLEGDGNLERWVAGGITASERRTPLTKWLAKAWEEVCSTTDFEKLGHWTGCLMTADGSDDHEVKPQGLQEYTFSDADAGDDFRDASDEDDSVEEEEDGDPDEDAFVATDAEESDCPEP